MKIDCLRRLAFGLRPSRQARVVSGAVLWVVVALPPGSPLLVQTMTRHMLVQIPLLAVAGWLLAQGTPGRVRRRLAAWNRGGASGLLLASMVSLLWMLPSALDAALENRWVAFAKVVGVPFLIGAPLALSWPKMGFVVRGVFFMELIASLFRLGWLYVASPAQLCSNYLVSDQQWLGELLFWVGGALTVFLAWKLLFGHVRVP